MDEIDIDDERHRREEAERRARRHRTREEVKAADAQLKEAEERWNVVCL